MDNEAFTVAEVCARLRLSKASVYRLFETGDLEYTKVLSYRRVTPQQLHKFLNPTQQEAA